MRIHFTDHKTPLQEGMVPDYSWAPKYTQPQSEPPDYQHNVYIPGTTSDYSTLKLAPRGELDVYNSFSTFGKKKKFISHYEQSFDGDDALISNAIFKWFTRYNTYYLISYMYAVNASQRFHSWHFCLFCELLYVWAWSFLLFFSEFIPLLNAASITEMRR